ncbi:F0F1 ATP synthase subunit gamma [Rhodobacter sp. NSM]|uniref:F0F1 ATP synthase subunit gamma n=1 Tax=Rhodobacter sp. NSM TaxID=3457501 RepID=UPI003FD1BE10
MNRPEEVRDRLANVGEIGSVISTLQALAAAHQREAQSHLTAIRAQEAVVAGTLSAALALAGAAPEDGRTGDGITVVIGAAQGFSGLYGERLAEAGLAAAASGHEIMAIGGRTVGVLRDRGATPGWSAEMAPHVPGVPGLASRLADAVFARLLERPHAAVHVAFCDPKDTSLVQTRRLFPFDFSRFPVERRSLPMVTLPPADLLAALIEEYVFTELCEVLMLGFAAENAARAEAMARAQTSVKRISADLKREWQQARQEQMTTEILELVSGSGAARTR